jgi:hypothetical protein
MRIVAFWRQPRGTLGCRRELNMSADMVGKIFVMVSSSGDLPTNPLSLRECMVCGKVFNREQSREHYYVPCPPSSEQPFAVTGRY